MTIDKLIRRLTAYESTSVFNPYRHVCDRFDRHDAARIRRRNLRVMLEAVMSSGTRTIWVARDLGYRGGRRTGLALTDEVNLPNAVELLGADRLAFATKGAPMAERTATVIWNMLARIDEPVMLWNVFPFHPFEQGEPMSNRCHTRAEREDARPFLYAILEIVQPTKIIAIGRDAEKAMYDLDVETCLARHPSYGGQSEFISQMEAHYGLSPQSSSQRDLLGTEPVFA